MAISSSPFAERTETMPTTKLDDNNEVKMVCQIPKEGLGREAPPKTSINTSISDSPSEGNSPIDEFASDNNIPTETDLKTIENLSVLDQNGRLVQFKDIYTGSNVARRVLVIFVRHFFCGNCQEFLRALTQSITPDDLLHLQVPTFIAIIGPGSADLIPEYQKITKCPFPIYADPKRKLYEALKMGRTLNLGTRPEYQRRSTVMGVVQSIGQGLRAIRGGKILKAGDMAQVGGEFLFEPLNLATPICSPLDEVKENAESKQLGYNGQLGVQGEEKRITWCHRMKNTRDHVEIPELREVLGFQDEGVPGKHVKRWERARLQRKGTGLSTHSSCGGSCEFVPKGSESERASASSEMLMDGANIAR